MAQSLVKTIELPRPRWSDRREALQLHVQLARGAAQVQSGNLPGVQPGPRLVMAPP